MTQSAENDALAPMLADGFDHHEHEHFKPGVRVRNRGERYDTARQWGTAEVVAVLRKPGAWEREWGRLNIEVLVRRDRADFGSPLTWWADYGTALPEGCWACGDGRLACSEHRVIPPVEHRLLNPPHPARCTCGWEPELGEVVMRAFDKHLRDMRVFPPASTVSDG